MIPLIFIMSLSLNFSLVHSYCLPGACPNVLRFTCQDYAAGLVTELRSYGVNSYPMQGWLNGKTHDWVGIQLGNNFYNIEPQTGKIVYPKADFLASYYWNGRRAVARGVA